MLRKTTSVTATHSLRALPVYPSHSSCLSLSASLFLLHSVFLSFSLPLPLPHWALVLLPLCRDPWRSPMAWTCPTRARSTPSTCVRSARCWVTTAAECNDRTPPPCPPPFCQPEKTPPPLRSSVLLHVSACGPAGVGMGGFGSCLVCRNGVTDVTAPQKARSLGLSTGGPGVCVEGTGLSRDRCTGFHTALGVPCRLSSSETPFQVSSLVLATSALNLL